MKKIIIGLILFFFISFIYNHFFLKSMITGVYVNTNYNKDYPIAEVPDRADTLVLFDNNTYTSGYYGRGKYKLNYSFGGTRILLISNNPSEGGFGSSFTRLYSFGNIKIDLFQDQDQYYEKID